MTDVFSADATTQLDENVDYLAELVGEGKKFSSDKELAKGKYFADKQVESLTKTLNELREELKTRNTTEDLVNRIASLSNNRQEPPREPPPNDGTAPTVTGLKQEDVERMFNEREAVQRQTSNLQSAQAKLIERYGDSAPVEIESKAKELGVTKEHLREMAKNTPSVFLALFTTPAAPKDVFGAPANGRTTNLNTGLAGVKKFSDYQRLRKENPAEYFGAKVQKEILSLADRLGGPGTDKYEAWKLS